MTMGHLISRRSSMRRILIGTLTLASIAFGAASAMAQTPTPVPNASGSQTTNPSTYRATAQEGRQRTMMMQQRRMGMTTGSVSRRHHVKRSRRTRHHSM
jgi:hypothetical protein